MEYLFHINYTCFTFILCNVLFSMGEAHNNQFKIESLNKRKALFPREKRSSQSWLNDPQREGLPYYDIKEWVQQLHLQHCAIVEIGEGFCALFVEQRGGPGFGGYESLSVLEFFLGVCECETMRDWRLCRSSLTQERLSDCTFQEAIAMANSSARIHRRLCDITGMAHWVEACNCSGTLAKQPLYKVTGFPTCFQLPLPKILCSGRSSCGTYQCKTNTIYGIHSVICDPNCRGRQPFCEEVGPLTTSPKRVTSYWSEWSTPACNATCGYGVMYSEAICINIASGKFGLDCLGPGAFCCPPGVPNCECHLSYDNNVLKVTRTLSPCPALKPCPEEDYDDMLLFKNSKQRGTRKKPLKCNRNQKRPYQKYLNTKHNKYVKDAMLKNANMVQKPVLKKHNGKLKFRSRAQHLKCMKEHSPANEMREQSDTEIKKSSKQQNDQRSDTSHSKKLLQNNPRDKISTENKKQNLNKETYDFNDIKASKNKPSYILDSNHFKLNKPKNEFSSDNYTKNKNDKYIVNAIKTTDNISSYIPFYGSNSNNILKNLTINNRGTGQNKKNYNLNWINQEPSYILNAGSNSKKIFHPLDKKLYHKYISKPGSEYPLSHILHFNFPSKIYGILKPIIEEQQLLETNLYSRPYVHQSPGSTNNEFSEKETYNRKNVQNGGESTIKSKKFYNLEDKDNLKTEENGLSQDQPLKHVTDDENGSQNEQQGYLKTKSSLNERKPVKSKPTYKQNENMYYLSDSWIPLYTLNESQRILTPDKNELGMQVMDNDSLESNEKSSQCFENQILNKNELNEEYSNNDEAEPAAKEAKEIDNMRTDQTSFSQKEENENIKQNYFHGENLYSEKPVHNWELLDTQINANKKLMQTKPDWRNSAGKPVYFLSSDRENLAVDRNEKSKENVSDEENQYIENSHLKWNTINNLVSEKEINPKSAKNENLNHHKLNEQELYDEKSATEIYWNNADNDKELNSQTEENESLGTNKLTESNFYDNKSIVKWSTSMDLFSENKKINKVNLHPTTNRNEDFIKYELDTQGTHDGNIPYDWKEVNSLNLQQGTQNEENKELYKYPLNANTSSDKNLINNMLDHEEEKSVKTKYKCQNSLNKQIASKADENEERDQTELDKLLSNDGKLMGHCGTLNCLDTIKENEELKTNSPNGQESFDIKSIKQEENKGNNNPLSLIGEYQLLRTYTVDTPEPYLQRRNMVKEENSINGIDSEHEYEKMANGEDSEEKQYSMSSKDPQDEFHMMHMLNQNSNLNSLSDSSDQVPTANELGSYNLHSISKNSEGPTMQQRRKLLSLDYPEYNTEENEESDYDPDSEDNDEPDYDEYYFQEKKVKKGKEKDKMNHDKKNQKSESIKDIEKDKKRKTPDEDMDYENFYEDDNTMDSEFGRRSRSQRGGFNKRGRFHVKHNEDEAEDEDEETAEETVVTDPNGSSCFSSFRVNIIIFCIYHVIVARM